jgi:hypothetical protein
MWHFHDFLTEKRDEIDEKYDYRYSVLILVFARLINDEWLDFDDLKGLAENKIDRIESLISIWNKKKDRNESAEPNKPVEQTA